MDDYEFDDKPAQNKSQQKSQNKSQIKNKEIEIDDMNEDIEVENMDNDGYESDLN